MSVVISNYGEVIPLSHPIELVPISSSAFAHKTVLIMRQKMKGCIFMPNIELKRDLKLYPVDIINSKQARARACM